MKKVFEKFSNLLSNKKVVIVASIILLLVTTLSAHRIRRTGYFAFPDPYAIADEHTNVWYGLTLRKERVPVAWSQLAAYGTSGVLGEVRGFKIFVNNKSATLGTIKSFPNPVTALLQLDIGKGLEHIRFVQPYMDHPPLGAIILSLGVMNNASSFPDVSAHEMRRMSVYIAILTTMLIFLAGWQITGNPLIGLLSAAIYGSAPSYILLSRYAQLENVLSPMFLITFNLLLLLRNKLSKRWNVSILVMTGVFAGLCALTKEIGWFSLLFGGIMLLLWRKGFRDILLFAVPAVLIGSLYFAWGLYLNPALFRNIFFYQGVTRGFVGSLNMLAAAIRVGILNFPFDGWWLGGFLSFLLISKKKEYTPLFAATLVIVGSILLIGGANYAWYYIPLIPFMCIATAIFFSDVLTQPTLFNILVFFFVFVSSSFYWGYGAPLAIQESTGFQQPFTLYRILLLITLLFGVFFHFVGLTKKIKWSWYSAMMIVFLFLLILNMKSIYFLQENWGAGKYPSLYSSGSGLIMK